MRPNQNPYVWELKSMDENFHNYGNFSNLILMKYLKISIEMLTQNIDELKIDKKKSYKSNKKNL